MKRYLTFLLAFVLIASGADIDIYQSNGTKQKKTISGDATLATSGAITLSGSATAPFADATAILKNSSDATKLLRFSLSGFTTATTRVITPPNADTSLPIATQTITLSGPTSARTITLYDANFSAARYDAANTFAGTQTFSSTIAGSINGNAATATALTPGSKINGVTYTGASDIVTNSIQFFGDGSDGALAGGAGTTTLTRDMYYTNITLQAGDKILLKNFRLFLSGILDMAAADAGAIIAQTGMDGGNASTSTAGSIPTAPTAGSVGGTIGTGLAGKAGVNTTGTNGTASSTVALGNGGVSGASGAGGTGVLGSVAGGTSATTAAITATQPMYRAAIDLIRGATLIQGGSAGSSGGSAGGTGAAPGGGSGGSGNGGQVGAIFAATINRGSSTPAACISMAGGVGGNGGNSPNNTAGGGGGSGGGGGGWLYIVVGTLTGSTATNCLDASGGNGGNGGNGLTTGVGGNGGHGGNGGYIQVFNIGAGTTSKVDNRASSDSGTTNGSGTTGGTGGTGVVTRLSL